MVEIKYKKLIGNKKEIVEGDEVAYDMYTVGVIYADGRQRKVRVFSAPGALDEKNPRQVDALIYSQLEDLMEKQGRRNYLFAGKLKELGGNYYPTTTYRTKSGRPANEEFEENLDDLYQAVTEEQSINNEEKELEAEISKNVKDMLREKAEKRKAEEAKKPQERKADELEIPEFLRRQPTTRPTARPVVIPEFLKKYQEQLAKNPDAAKARRTSAGDLEIPDFLKKKPEDRKVQSGKREVPPVPEFKKPVSPRDFEIPSFLRRPSEDKKTAPTGKETELEVPDFLKDDKKANPKTPEETYEEMLEKINAQIEKYDKMKKEDPSSVDDKMYQAALAIKKMLEVQLGIDEDKGAKTGRQEDDGMDR